MPTDVYTGHLNIVNPICVWITTLGDHESISVKDIFDLVKAYHKETDIGFTVTKREIMGVVAYKLHEPDSGDMLTGCSRP